MERPTEQLEDNASLTFEGWGYRHASRRHFAVRDLNLTIEAGQRVLLIGASGIGKSTILEGAAGLLGDGATGDGTDGGDAQGEDAEGGVTEGRILVDGVPVHRAVGRVGLVLQDPDAQAVFQRLGDNVAFGPENLDVPRDEIWRRVRESLAAVGLDGVQLHRSTMHLSGGQMQRLALAGALAMRPGVLLLDEPTANLDPDGVTQIVGAVRDVLAAHRSTMVLVEHRAGPWIDLIDRVVVLGLETDDQMAARVERRGLDDEVDRSGFRRTVVVADGTPDEVFGDASLDFASLGIWVPERYRRADDAIRRIRVDGEPDSDPAVGTGETVLSCRDLAIGRGGKAIAEHIDLDFAAGQITALVGANGAGKSTLSLTLSGLLEPVAGRVVASPRLAEGADGDEPIRWKSTDLASRISYVFQNPEHQFARGSVLEEVMLAPLRCGMGREEAESRARTLLRRFSLSQYANANPYTLSGGEKRRLTVASALAAAPRVLLLDEPTFGQDRRTWGQIVELIGTLRGDDVSVIVVTHDRELVTALGARLVELVPAHAAGEWDVRDGADPSGAAAVPDASGDADASEAHGPRVIAVSEVNAREEPPRQSSRSRFLASLNPAIRLIGAFAASIPMLFSLDWVSASVAVALEFALLMAAGFSPLRIVKSTWPVWVGAPTSALAVLLYGKAGGSTWWQWGLIHVTDRSAELAVATSVRILAIGIPAIITVLGIDATDLADSFSQILHLPDRFVYGGLAGMRLFSVLQDDWTALTASRRSRGLGDESRVRAFAPQAFALLVLSIRRSTTLATAMQSRGFGGDGPRSHARVSEVHVRDWAFVAVCLAVPAAALTSAWQAGTFSFMGG
ncbi:Hydroxymethylpyrimidine transport ATP-binding protein [Bifidobacterium sp. DSM 109958]|uniref:Hydroxymethylpyrimidine transport ATP-binding protein n=1 Tax=Bifidobacterium moraviense TaxID=2675323 RepID=A0A7Y0F0R9_9BIFI|nr:ATP-binding cassette domain-containing protein [Bifidobacterium sp. DSM 109958]NMM99892.1 Hydroxymethylpyrimidine transport ATP-binding protein [Bifidobacterium sp. DSM 109958]